MFKSEKQHWKLLKRALSGVFFGLILFRQPTYGAVFTLPVLNSEQIETLFDVLASTSVFRSLEPPSHPDRFGLWFNARLSATNSSALAAFANLSAATLPFGSIQAGINGPFGLGVEFGFLPSPSISGTTLSSFGTDIKWNINKASKSFLPFNATVRALYSSAGLSYEQNLSGSTLSVEYSTHIYGGTLDISKRLLIFEPYIGYGFLYHSSSLSATGNASLFDSSFPAGTVVVPAAKSSGWFRAGIELKLLILAIGAQYDSVYSNDSYSIKLGLKF